MAGHKRSIADLQAEVASWVAHNFPEDSRTDVALGTVEEIGEVAEIVLDLMAMGGRMSRATLKQRQGIRGTRDEWDAQIRKEVADVFIKLCHLAAKCGFDLDCAIIDRWDEVKQRDWVANPEGHGLPL
jgi:NTP pyrophosphatase (non-canonical NTP hydrolase)